MKTSILYKKHAKDGSVHAYELYAVKFHKPKFIWYDFWVGGYYDRKEYTLYINPLPMIVFRIRFLSMWLCELKEASK